MHYQRLRTQSISLVFLFVTVFLVLALSFTVFSLPALLQSHHHRNFGISSSHSWQLRLNSNSSVLFPQRTMNASSIGARAKILLLGSSMTQRSFSIEHQGWGNYLANWYSRTADVLNRGSGGYNSRWLRSFLPQIINSSEKPPDMTILFVGNNDAIEEGESQHVSLSEYRQNLEMILEQLYSLKKNMIVLLVTTTPVNEHLKPLHSNSRRQLYAETIRDLVHDHERITEQLALNHSLLLQQDYRRPRYIGLVDLWGESSPLHPYDHSALGIIAEDLHDGAHLDKNGNRKVFEAIKLCVNANFPFFSPDHLAVPRNHLRVRKSSFSGNISSSSVPIETEYQHLRHNKKHSQMKSQSESESLPKHAASDEWWIEPSLHLTLPPWHTLIPDTHDRNE